MARIKIKDIPKDQKISREAMKRVIGGNIRVIGGNIAAPFIPGGAVVSAAISGLSGLKDSSGGDSSGGDSSGLGGSYGA
jgi:hypothetical protein